MTTAIPRAIRIAPGRQPIVKPARIDTIVRQAYAARAAHELPTAT